MKELIEHIVKSIVNTPDEVVVSEKESVDFPGLIIYSIKVAETDKGVVIGRGGRTINAIRDLVTIAAIRLQKRVKVLVEEGERRERPASDKPDDQIEQKGEDMLADDSDIEGLV
ncbi:KH domain-containing protein [Candidatus Dojkabacteria bacterium]|jgi:hypothetical protein|nr:KH domain-containing protein [Candidatus Dojkabacteria bacterium]